MKGLRFNWYRDLSLKRKLTLVYTVFVISVILIIGTSTYKISESHVKNGETRLLLQNLKQTCSIIDFNLEMYMRKSEIVFSNTIIQTAVRKEYTGLDDIYDAYENHIYKILDPIIQEMTYPDVSLVTSQPVNSSDIAKIVIYVSNNSLIKDGGIIKDFEEIKGEKWVKDIYNTRGRFFWRGVYEEKGVNYISINKVLKAFNDLRDLGILSIMIPESNIKQLLGRNNENMQGRIYLIDSKNNFISGSNAASPVEKNESDGFIKTYLKGKDGITTYSSEKGEYILAYATSVITGWKLVALLPSNTIANRLKSIEYVVLVVLVISTLLCIIITVFISHMTTRRLSKIMKKINRLKKDRNAELVQIEGNDEIGQLDADFNEMIINLNCMVENEKRSQVQRTGLQLELLQSQINPHLLYNTLSTISWKSKKSGQTDVYNVTDDLIRFFKYFLNKGSMVSCIAHEIEMVKKYLSILRFTYNMQFEQVIDVGEEVLKLYSLNLILQPIVENALVHGIKPLGREGLIELKGSISGGDVNFLIRDNGMGMDSETVDRLNRGESVSTSGGYGLVNVTKRIKLYFGEDYGVCIRSEIGKGTEVTVRVPVFECGELEKKLNTVI